MEPISEVQAAADQLAVLSVDTVDLLDDLRAVSALAVEVVPSCLGVSITLVVGSDPLTVTATAPELKVVDAAQYLTDGPCVEASRSGEQTRVDDALDEDRWHAFAQTAAAHGIRSSLSIPLRRPDGSPCGALNLYSGEPAAFQDTDQVVCELFGVHVEGAVANADLSFATRDRARELPQQLADKGALDQAVHALTSSRGWPAVEARERIDAAARSAGVSLRSAADLVIQLDL